MWTLPFLSFKGLTTFRIRDVIESYKTQRSEDMETIGNRLRAFRKSTRLSQKAFSELAGASQSSINRFENNQVDVPHTVLLWYADYFDVSADCLLCRTDSPQGKLYEYKPVYNEDN